MEQSVQISTPPAVSHEERARQRRRAWLIPVLTGAFMVALMVAMYLLRHQLGEFTALGYGGAFLVTVIGSSTIGVPTPSLPVVFTIAGLPGYQPWLVALLATVGPTAGQYLGFLFGRSTQEVLTDTRLYRRLLPLMERWSVPVMLILSIVPNPVIKIASAAAGASGMPHRLFAVVVFIGKFIKYLIVAYAGLIGIEALTAWIGAS